ncbi:MAG TPA: class I tRNA ligase family protein, partial [Solirubrobacteraceae bacterium]
RFVLMQAQPTQAEPDPTPRAVEDRWLLSRLERAKAATRGAIEAYEFHRAALGLYDFVYGELCDWYLEWVKGRDDAQPLLLHVLRETLALAHPVIPFVTEAIWEHLPGTEGLLAMAEWPAPAPDRIDSAAEDAVTKAIEAVQALRSWRDEAGARPGAFLPARLDAPGYEEVAPALARLARLELDGTSEEPIASVTVPGGQVHLLPSDAVDLAAAERRVAERRAKLEAEIKRAEGKLANEGFVAKAPAAVVEAERDKLARLRAELEEL